MSQKILVIRSYGITGEINQDVGQTTEYMVSDLEPISLIHYAHLDLLREKFNSATGSMLSEADFLDAIGIADNRVDTGMDTPGGVM